MNFILLAACSAEDDAILIQNGISLFGNVLSILDSADQVADSCQDLFTYSSTRGLERYEEIVLEVGTGHGIVYQPLDEWVIPAVEWIGLPSQ